jgi:hypothetical protein
MTTEGGVAGEIQNSKKAGQVNLGSQTPRKVVRPEYGFRCIVYALLAIGAFLALRIVATIGF